MSKSSELLDLLHKVEVKSKSFSEVFESKLTTLSKSITSSPGMMIEYIQTFLESENANVSKIKSSIKKPLNRLTKTELVKIFNQIQALDK